MRLHQRQQAGPRAGADHACAKAGQRDAPRLRHQARLPAAAFIALHFAGRGAQRGHASHGVSARPQLLRGCCESMPD